MELIIQLILGAIGGNVGGAMLKNLSLGPLGNSIAGIIGGPIGGLILNAVLGDGGAGGGMLGDVAGGGVGGMLLMIVVGLIKNAMAPKS